MHKRGKSVEEGLECYKSTLQKHTSDRCRQNIAIAVALVSFCMVIAGCVFSDLGEGKTAALLIILGAIGTITGGFFVFSIKTDDNEWKNVQSYKNNVIQPLIEECFEDEVYETYTDFQGTKVESLGFIRKKNRYASFETKDCIRATIDGISFVQMELLQIMYRPRQNDKIYYKGMLYDILWDGNVTADIIIYANHFSLISKYAKEKSLMPIQGFGKPEGILVYSNDRNTVDAILTTERMNSMKGFFIFFQKPVAVRICNGHIYFTLEGIYDVFEPQKNREVDYDAVRSKVLSNLGLTKRLLQALQLNT